MIDLETEQVLEAADGAEALEILEKSPVDLVLTDLNMPTMDGFEMIYHMRGNEATKSIPIVIVSTESSATRVEKLLVDGVKDYLHKPFTPEKLRDVIMHTVPV